MSDLRAIAEAATPGKRMVANDVQVLMPASRHRNTAGGHFCAILNFTDREDAVFVAAWSPDRALAALDVIEAAARHVGRGYEVPDALRAALDRWTALTGDKP